MESVKNDVSSGSATPLGMTNGLAVPLPEAVSTKTKFVSPSVPVPKVVFWGGRVPASRFRSWVTRTSMPALSTWVLTAVFVPPGG